MKLWVYYWPHFSLFGVQWVIFLYIQYKISTSLLSHPFLPRICNISPCFLWLSESLVKIEHIYKYLLCHFHTIAWHDFWTGPYSQIFHCLDVAVLEPQNGQFLQVPAERYGAPGRDVSSVGTWVWQVPTYWRFRLPLPPANTQQIRCKFILSAIKIYIWSFTVNARTSSFVFTVRDAEDMYKLNNLLVKVCISYLTSILKF